MNAILTFTKIKLWNANDFLSSALTSFRYYQKNSRCDYFNLKFA